MYYPIAVLVHYRQFPRDYEGKEYRVLVMAFEDTSVDGAKAQAEQWVRETVGKDFQGELAIVMHGEYADINAAILAGRQAAELHARELEPRSGPLTPTPGGLSDFTLP